MYIARLIEHRRHSVVVGIEGSLSALSPFFARKSYIIHTAGKGKTRQLIVYKKYMPPWLVRMSSAKMVIVEGWGMKYRGTTPEEIHKSWILEGTHQVFPKKFLRRWSAWHTDDSDLPMPILIATMTGGELPENARVGESGRYLRVLRRRRTIGNCIHGSNQLSADDSESEPKEEGRGTTQ